MTIISADRRSYPQDSQISNWAAPDGWRIRRFDWPASGSTARGAMLFLTGRGDIFEKYLEAIAHFHEAGWHVTSFDWRGQGGAGRLSDNPLVGHASDFAVWVADLAAFYREWASEHAGRSDERSVGKACVGTGRSRVLPYH